MGRKAAEIQRDLEQQRSALEDRIQRLQQRVREDAGAVGDEARADLDRALGPDSAAAEHPKALVAGAAGAGVVLGMLSPGVPVPRPHLRSQNGHGAGSSREGDESHGDSRAKRLASAATGAAAGSAQRQINDVLSAVWASFKTGFRRNPMADETKEERERLEREQQGREGKADPRTRYLTREEIDPRGPDVDIHDDRTPEKLLHEAEVEDYDPRAEIAASPGLQGEGLLLAHPETDGPLDEHRSERRTGQ